MGTTSARNWKDASPRIIVRRFARIHRDLLTATSKHAPVATIARQGFVHMADFSRRYRITFGCSPLDTQKNKAALTGEAPTAPPGDHQTYQDKDKQAQLGSQVR
ncbi:AraC family transcriptional regulator [Rhizobium leguminosarum bv. viciae]|nr:helix-turn-helix domain-containing protein [Rhizobium leguminosarum bv. viciae]TBZ54213.1 AraC family transcriptional regulator [Rhizobium leguminosarum bv. viciae]